jgi:hypothetical protein
MDFLLVSDGLLSGAAEGMGKVRGTKRFQLQIGKLKASALIKSPKVSYALWRKKQRTRGQLPFSNMAIPNFRGFFLGDFIRERMHFSTTLGSSSSSKHRMPSFAPVY